MARVGLVLSCAAALVACGGGVEPTSVAGTGDAATAGVVVVCSDYSSTAIAVLDGEALGVTAPLVLHSGAVAPLVQTALGGDVDLPTRTEADGRVVLLDRFPNGVLTRLDAVTADVVAQVDVGEGFAPNPHDALELEDGRWLVTRYGHNAKAEAADGSDAGDDVLVLDEAWGIEGRVALDDDEDLLSRPDRLLQVGDAVWVTLGRVSATWDTYGEGAIAHLDVAGAPTLVGITEVAQTSNCGAAAVSTDRVALSCAGDIVELAPQPERSALVLLDHEGAEVARLQATDPRVELTFAAGVVLLADGRVAAALYGTVDGAPDRVIAWDPGADDVEIVHEASGAFRIFGLATTASGALIVPDADPGSPALCVVAGGASTRCLDPCAATGLPPRQVRRITASTGPFEAFP